VLSPFTHVSVRRYALPIVVLSALSIAVGILALMPVTTSDLESHARTLTFNAALAEVTARIASERAPVVPQGQSIFLNHGQRARAAALLLHGFTNSPFDSLGRILFREGYNVYIPRLPHHAERRGTAALGQIRARELCAMADSSVDIASALGDTVIVMGLSVGGTMAAWIAQHRPEPRRVIVIAPLLALARVPRPFRTLLVNATVRLPNFTYAEKQNSSEADRELGWSSRAIGEILRVGVAVQRTARATPAASRSVAIVLNPNDKTISLAPVLALAREWMERGASARVHWLPAALRLPHDIIDPRQPVRRPDIVYPLLIELAGAPLRSASP
jgi:esterase/lipase